MTTKEHIKASTWWPTKPATEKNKFVGTETCATCHAGIAESQEKSQMARTLTTADTSAVLHQHISAEYRSGPYQYLLLQKDEQVTLTVALEKESRSAVLQWAFGSGDVGQSYLWEDGHGLRESRFNYFSTLNGFAGTPGRLHGSPTSIDMALGRPLEDFEAKTCFSCHTTTMSSATPLNLKSLVPGVSCEACHGPGADHVAAAEAHENDMSKSWEKHIVNTKRMVPAQAVDLCGACHSTSWDVRIMGAVGAQTVRFPAYRLQKSRCWGTNGDARITCTACHDPHEPLQREPIAYDNACLTCHLKKGEVAQVEQHRQPACPVASTKCVSCHMPKHELSELHYKFTDHLIRIVRNNAAFPD